MLPFTQSLSFFIKKPQVLKLTETMKIALIKHLTEPSDEDTTRLGKIPHEPRQGTITPIQVQPLPMVLSATTTRNK